MIECLIRGTQESKTSRFLTKYYEEDKKWSPLTSLLHLPKASPSKKQAPEMPRVSSTFLRTVQCSTLWADPVGSFYSWFPTSSPFSYKHNYIKKYLPSFMGHKRMHVCGKFHCYSMPLHFLFCTWFSFCFFFFFQIYHYLSSISSAFVFHQSWLVKTMSRLI